MGKTEKTERKSCNQNDKYTKNQKMKIWVEQAFTKKILKLPQCPPPFLPWFFFLKAPRYAHIFSLDFSA